MRSIFLRNTPNTVKHTDYQLIKFILLINMLIIK